MKKFLIIVSCFICAAFPNSVRSQDTSADINIPESLVGVWYSKTSPQGSSLDCQSPKSRMNGIHILGDGEIKSLNGSYLCKIKKLEYFNPASYGDSFLGVWQFEADCKSSVYPSLLSPVKENWNEKGDYKLTFKDKELFLLEENIDQSHSFMNYEHCSQ